MQYIFTVNPNGQATQIGGYMPDDNTIVTSQTFPVREERKGYRAELRYDAENGVHWEYIPYTPAEMRETAYSNYRCIEYGGELLTVDEANRLWEAYCAEGSDKATALTALIAEAKSTIRKIHPDEPIESEDEDDA